MPDVVIGFMWWAGLLVIRLVANEQFLSIAKRLRQTNAEDASRARREARLWQMADLVIMLLLTWLGFGCWLVFGNYVWVHAWAHLLLYAWGTPSVLIGLIMASGKFVKWRRERVFPDGLPPQLRPPGNDDIGLF